MTDIVVIPIREHSKGIRNKNIYRFKNGLSSLEMLQKVLKKLEDVDIYVSTESILIKKFAKSIGLKVIMRSLELSNDEATIDDVVEDLIRDPIIDRYKNIWIIQATCPLISLNSLKLIRKTLNNNNGIDTVFSAREVKSFIWKTSNKTQQRLYKSRKNRQVINNPYIAETGAITLSRLNILKNKKNRFIDMNCKGVVLPERENIDIDSHNDIHLINMHIESNKGKIIFITDGNNIIGSGHLYRTITLASSSYPYESIIFCKETEIANQIFKRFEYEYISYENTNDLLRKLKKYQIKAIVLDKLETSESDFNSFKELRAPLVSLEDYGDPAFKNANLIINSLYETSIKYENLYSGYKYEAIRPDVIAFSSIKIGKILNERLKKLRIIFCFGGTDPNKFMYRVPNILSELDLLLKKELDVRIIYSINENNIINFNNNLYNFIDIKTISHTSIIAKELHESDIVVCSNGRMVYEAMVLNNIVISIHQHSRESTNTFCRDIPGNVQLPLYKLLKDNEIAQAINNKINNFEKQKNNKKLKSFQNKVKEDILLGTERIMNLIRNL